MSRLVRRTSFDVAKERRDYYFPDGDWAKPFDSLWREIFHPIAGRPGAVFLEVGSYYGLSALWWLRNLLTAPDARLVCVDPWHIQEQWRRFYTTDSADYEAIFDWNLKKSGLDRQVRKIKAESRRVLGELPDEYFDGCFINGSHVPCDALVDGLLALPLLKDGAVMLFDDYGADSNRFSIVPRTGIDAFAAICAGQVEMIHKGYQIAFRKLPVADVARDASGRPL